MSEKIEIQNIEFEAMMKSLGVGRLFNQHLPARISYPLALLMKEVKAKFDKFMDERLEIILKYCDRDESNNPIQNDKNEYNFTDKKKGEAFVEEFNAILSDTTVINQGKVIIEVSEMDDAGIKLSPNDMVDLITLVEFVDTPKEIEASDKVVSINRKKEE